MDYVSHFLTGLVEFAFASGCTWLFLARPAIKRAYQAGSFDSFPDHFEAGRAAAQSEVDSSPYGDNFNRGYSRGWDLAKSFYSSPEHMAQTFELLLLNGFKVEGYEFKKL